MLASLTRCLSRWLLGMFVGPPPVRVVIFWAEIEHGEKLVWFVTAHYADGRSMSRVVANGWESSAHAIAVARRLWPDVLVQLGPPELLCPK